MVIICLNSKNCKLTRKKKYKIISTRIWNNGYVQYLIEDNDGNQNWFSKKRFTNRKEKLIEINKLNESSNW
jgi:hypothetical protein